MSKKFISIIMALLMIVSLMPFTAFAAQSQPKQAPVSDFKVEEHDGYLCLSEYHGTDTDIILPTTYNGQEIKGLVGTFDYNTTVKSVVVPEGYEYILSPFYYATGLESVTMLCKNVTRTFSSTFEGCTNLKSVVLPDSLERLRACFFSGCSSLENVTLPKGLRQIGPAAFSGCTSLKNINLPDGLALIDSKAFKDCTSLQSIVLPDTVRILYNSAFENCTNLASVKLSKNIEALYSRTFANCPKLKSIELYDGLFQIGDEVFLNTSISEIVIPGSVQYIGSNSFDGAPLAKIKCPEKSLAHRYANDKNIPTELTPAVEVTSLYFDTEETIMIRGINKHVSLNIAPFNFTEEFSYSTSNRDVAFLTVDNYIVANSVGSAVLTIKTANCTASVKVIVIEEKNYDESPIRGVSCIPATKYGEEAKFKADVTADVFDNFSWQCSEDNGQTWHNTYEEGFNTDCLHVVLTPENEGNLYRFAFISSGPLDSSDYIDAVSEPMCLELERPFEITKQPQSYAGLYLDNAVFSVEATGNGLSYEWQESYDLGKTWSAFGSNQNSVNVQLNDSTDNLYIRCKITDKHNKVKYTDTAVLSLRSSKINIIENPQTYYGKFGDTAKFKVNASGDNLSYRWLVSKDGGISWQNSRDKGNTTDTLYVDFTKSRTNFLYKCVIKSAGKNTVETAPAKLTIKQDAITITESPKHTSAPAGEKAPFHVDAKGQQLKYQWQVSYDGGRIWCPAFMTGFNQPTSYVRARKWRNNFLYRCRITDANGIVTYSDIVTISAK